MQRYDSFWEFRALGYVTLLDQYVTRAVKGKKMIGTLNPTQMKSLEALADSLFSQCSVEMKSVNVRRIAESVQWQRPLTFREKFDTVMEQTDHDITQIVDLDEDAFTYIKQLRDDISHGKDHGLSGESLTRVSSMIAKIELLLTYWAFMDFGLIKGDFLRGLSRTHNRIRLVADINQMQLDRANNEAKFFTMGEAQFQALRKVKNIEVYACFVLGANEELQFSDRYTNMYWNWMKGGMQRESKLYTTEEILQVPKDAIQYAGKGYIECGTDKLQLFSMNVLDPAKITDN